MKRRAFLGQWNTPPQVFFPSTSSGMKKSSSTPDMPSMQQRLGSPGVNPPDHGDADGGAFDMDLGGVADADGPVHMFEAPPYENLAQPAMTGVGPTNYRLPVEGNALSKKAASHHEFNQASHWSDKEDGISPTRGSYVHNELLYGSGSGSLKRSAQSLKRPAPAPAAAPVPRSTQAPPRRSPSTFVNPRHEIIRSSSTSAIMSVPAETGDFGLRASRSRGDLDEAKERHNRRLARNRASARMRRLKKKTMTDTLSAEVEDLVRSINFLKVLVQQRSASPSSAQGLLGYSRATLEAAFEASQQPINPIEDSELMINGDVASSHSAGPQSAEKSKLLAAQVREQLAQLNNNDLRALLLDHLVGTKSQDRSGHTVRRQTAVQTCLDFHISWAEMLRTFASQNSSLYSVMNGLAASGGQGPRAADIRRTGTQMVLTEQLTRPSSASSLNSSSTSFSGSGNGGMPRKQPGQRKLGVDPFPGSNVFGSMQAGAGPGGAQATPQEAAKMQHALSEDLLRTLNLSEDQRAQIADLGNGLKREQLACHAFSRVLTCLAAKRWMEYPSIEQIQVEFRGVLLPTQMDKFYSWSRKNLSAIDALDIAPPM